MKNDLVYLGHILEAIHVIQVYVKDFDSKKFYENSLVQDAAVRQLQIIGEASRCLSAEIKDKIVEVPWEDIIGMRNKLIHEYFGVDLNIVWSTIENYLPLLEKALKQYL